MGPDTCRRCGRGVLLLPVSTGTLEAFEPQEYPVDDVDERDRFVIHAHRGAATAIDADETVPTCLRRHRCSAAEQVIPAESPPTSGQVIPPESPSPRLRPSVATRSDFQGLHTLRTQAELLRLQTLGQLRTHPGSRRYTPVSVPAALVALIGLDDQHCMLCRCRLVENGQLAVATVDGTSTALAVCLPECRRPDPRHQQAGDS